MTYELSLCRFKRGGSGSYVLKYLIILPNHMNMEPKQGCMQASACGGSIQCRCVLNVCLQVVSKRQYQYTKWTQYRLIKQICVPSHICIVPHMYCMVMSLVKRNNT